MLVLAPAASPGANKCSDSIADLIVRSLDGKGNNLLHPDWGQAGTQYLRVAPPNYADGVSTMVERPVAAVRQQSHLQRRRPEPLLRERHLAVGLGVGPVHRPRLRPPRRDAGRTRPDRVRPSDPLEAFTNDFGVIGLLPHAGRAGHRSHASPRQQINTSRSYIDASNVYGVTHARLDWLRRPVDGNPPNNSATLLLPGRLPARVTPRQRRDRPADGPDGPAAGAPRPGRGRG